MTAIIEARRAFREGRPHRAWMFFYGREIVFNQIELEVANEPKVDVLVRPLPQRWTLRPGNAYRTKRKPQLPGAVPAEPLSILDLPDEPSALDLPLRHAKDKSGLEALHQRTIVDKVQLSTQSDNTPSEEVPDDAAGSVSPAVETSAEEMHPVKKDVALVESIGADPEVEAVGDELYSDLSASPRNVIGLPLSSPSHSAEVTEPVGSSCKLGATKHSAETLPTVSNVIEPCDERIGDHETPPPGRAESDRRLKSEPMRHTHREIIHVSTPQVDVPDEETGHRSIRAVRAQPPVSVNPVSKRGFRRILDQLLGWWRH